MASRIVGRDAELETLHAFMRLPDGPGVLVLEGDAGVGKTTLWTAGIAAAEQQGIRVLQARPVESETGFSFSGLGDLLDPALEEMRDSLPRPQWRALGRALVLEEDGGPDPDPRSVGVAVLNTLRALAGSGPLLVGIDDVQWLDAASCGALGYAARRLQHERIGLLLARRANVDASLVDDLRRPLGERLRDLAVGPLDASSLNRVVQEHLDVTLPRPLLAEVHQASGGNPFYALEIVRALQRTRRLTEVGQPLPLSDSLRALVHGRLLSLPGESREWLVAAAALRQPTVSLVEAATGVPTESGLRPALEAHVVELDGDLIRFTHPLLAAGAYETADPVAQARIHGRLAELVDDPESRARHLAAATMAPDESVARAIDEGAARAIARGAPRAGALLYERAAALTPASDEDAARRRRVEAAYAHHAAGDTERARALLEPAIERAQLGPERAALLVALARVRSYDDEVRDASELYRQAVAEAEEGSLVQAYAQEGLGGTLFRLRERLAEAVDVASRAASTAHRHGATQLEAEALATKAVAAAALGRPEAVDAAEAALALQSMCADRPVLRQPAFAATCVHFWHDDLLGAHDDYQAMVRAASELGDESSVPYTHVMLGQIACARGCFDDALQEVEAGMTMAAQARQRALVAYTLAVRALAQAHLGRAEEARLSAGRALDLAQRTSGVPAWIFATWALGHLALAEGEPATAFDVLRPLVEHHRREQIEEPGALPFMPDAIEALVAAGRADEAEELLVAYQAAAARLGRRRGLGAARRVRGLLVGARGDLESALRELEASVELYSAGDTPFERARALLGLGAMQRRMKRRREAREILDETLAVFERLGAALWAERARAELRRISGRAPRPHALTPAEERVAALVAEGKTNREVAAALFLSERTVEGHLSHVFAKLGVRNRAEVARALQTQGVASPNTGEEPVSAESVSS